ncbi:MAG: GNAT family N-acetyltransferase [Arenimonas sp.]|nr:GNAT family N-acetyltransferase [Arenimonas sp.]
MIYRIERWSGQPGVAEQLAAWHVREWQNVFPEWTEQKAIEEFHAQLRDNHLPATWLAYQDQQLVGSISALLEDAPELNDVAGPWLASFYVVPECRGQGVGQQLIIAAKNAVANLGYPQWYLFTPHHQEYYSKYGWQLHERRHLHGERVALMAQRLG